MINTKEDFKALVESIEKRVGTNNLWDLGLLELAEEF